MNDVLPLVLIFTLISWGSYLNIGTREYEMRQHLTDNIVYNYTQVFAKKGQIAVENYEELLGKIDKYGNSTVRLIAERFESDGTVTTKYDNDIIGIDLRKEEYDLITVYMQDDSNLILNKVYSSYPINIETNYKIISKACAYIE